MALRFNELHLEPWLRRGKIIVIGYAAFVALTGLAFAAGWLISGHFGKMVVVVAVTAACCGLGAVAWGVLVIIGQTDVLGRNHRDVLARLDAIEDCLQKPPLTPIPVEGLPATAPPARPGGADAPPASRPAGVPTRNDDVEGRLDLPASCDERKGLGEALCAAGGAGFSGDGSDEARFDSAMQIGDLAACRRMWQTLRTTVDEERASQLQKRVEELSARRAIALRAEFAEQVRRQNYEAAMLTGDLIAELFPQSRMTADYKSIKPHLQRRANR